MVLVPVAVVGAFFAGIEWKHVAIGLVIIALLVPLAWNMRRHLKPYQQQRIQTFLHPEEDQRGAGYQILQSEIAVGSGGFWGKGFGKGSQNQLGFVPFAIRTSFSPRSPRSKVSLEFVSFCFST